jgi:hypothetical protein
MHAAGHAVEHHAETLGGRGLRLVPLCLSVGAIGLACAIVLGVLARDGFRELSYRYVVAYAFGLNLAQGALFFVLIQHITRAGWSVVVRRFAELTSLLVIPLAILFVPILLPVLGGQSPLYEWNHADVVAHDLLIQKKLPYLNAGFFTVRWVLYFVIWTAIAVKFRQWSRLQDETGDVRWSETCEQWAGPATILLALTSTFAAFDLLMSLDAHWFSTIYGVYFFAGSMVTFFAVTILSMAAFRRMGLFREALTIEHLHDLGKLLFGFNCFWAYIAFSQYLLVWYANIPEETQWFLKRQQHGWEFVSIVLIVGHFAIPFLGMMSREVKRSFPAMVGWSLWLLLMHWVDLYWLTLPHLTPQGPTVGLIDLGCLVGLAGLLLAAWFWLTGDHILTPQKDPRLSESLAFHNI